MYEELTLEEAIEKLKERDILIATMESDAKKTAESGDVATKESEAEISSLKTELEENILKLKAANEELAKTKELNFTLSRQVAREQAAVDTETALHSIFGKGE